MKVLNSKEIRIAVGVLLLLVILLVGWMWFRDNRDKITSFEGEDVLWMQETEQPADKDAVTERQRVLAESEGILDQFTCLTKVLEKVSAQNLTASEGDRGLINTTIAQLENKINYLEILNYYLAEEEITLPYFQEEYKKCKEVLSAPEFSEFGVNPADCLN